MNSIYNSTPAIWFVGGPCGSGKSYAAIEHAAAYLKGVTPKWNYCLALPTKLLIDQVAKDFRKRNIEPVIFTEDTHRRVVPSITRWLREKRRKGEVLLITQAAYFKIPYFHRRKDDWKVFIDEVPQIDTFYEPTLPRSWKLLEEYLEIGEIIGDLGVMQAKNPSQLEKYLELPRDDCEEKARQIVAEVANPNKVVFVDLKSWGKMTERHEVSKGDDKLNKIFFLVMMTPDPFIGTIVMGADVRNSLLWHWTEVLGATRWVEATKISAKLRYQKYSESVGKRLHVKHVLDEGSWSKNLRDRDGVWSDMEKKIRKALGDKPFLLVQNKDHTDSSLSKLTACVPMSSVCHGLNSYQHHTTIVFTAALNRNPKHISMLMDLGISEEVQRASIIHSVLHQSVMRTALRDLKSDKAVEVIVPDRWMADALVHAIGGAWVGDVEGKYEERFRLPVEVENDIGTVGGDAQNEERVDTSTPKERAISFITPPNRSCNLNSNDKAPPTVSKSLLTLLTHKWNDDPNYRHPIEIRRTEVTPLQLVKIMRKLSEQRITNKESDFLFQLTKFKPGTRSLSHANFLSSSGHVRDYDNGSLSIQEFIRIFWHEAQSNMKRAFIIYNTHSRSPEKPNKFRVIMPFNGPCMSIEEYKAISDYVTKREAAEGYPPESSGLVPAVTRG